MRDIGRLGNPLWAFVFLLWIPESGCVDPTVDLGSDAVSFHDSNGASHDDEAEDSNQTSPSAPETVDTDRVTENLEDSDSAQREREGDDRAEWEDWQSHWTDEKYLLCAEDPDLPQCHEIPDDEMDPYHHFACWEEWQREYDGPDEWEPESDCLGLGKPCVPDDDDCGESLYCEGELGVCLPDDFDERECGREYPFFVPEICLSHAEMSCFCLANDNLELPPQCSAGPRLFLEHCAEAEWQ